jgi:hypothetical protein
VAAANWHRTLTHACADRRYADRRDLGDPLGAFGEADVSERFAGRSAASSVVE